MPQASRAAGVADGDLVQEPVTVPVAILPGLPAGSLSPPAGSGSRVESENVTLPPELESYLPAASWRQLAAGPPRRGVLLNTLDRLRSILYLLATYLPQHLVQEKMRRPVAGQVGGQWLGGSLLFADVSGFTALSERLAGLGQEGTEQLTRTINRYFEAMLDILGQSGGVLLKFAGDALLVYFPEMEGGEQARWAVRAGLRMMAAMPRLAAIDAPPAEGVSLRMKVGIGTGGFLGASLGAGQRMEYVVLGEAVTRAMAAEGAAEPGLVVADRATADHLDPACCLERGGGFFAVGRDPAGELGEFEVKAGQRRARGAIPLSASPHAIVAQIQVALRQIQALTPYLAPELVEQIVARARQRRVESDNRLATVVFVNFTGLEPLLSAWGRGGVRQVTALLDDYFKTMQCIVADHGGVVSRIDPYSHGSKMLILFGAPLAHEDDPLRAVSAALKMGEELTRLNERWQRRLASLSLADRPDPFPLQQRIGITLGPTFAGQAGSATRREYTVMGDDVNLAARLMAAAQPGQVLISQRVYDAVVDRFTAVALPPIRVKGKSQPIPIYDLAGLRDDPLACRLRQRGLLLGREAELADGQAILHQALAGQGTLLVIRGEAGLGKSRLADELVVHELARGVRVLFTACHSYSVDTPYSAWLPLLKAALAIPSDGPLEGCTRALAHTLAGLGLPGATYAEPLANLLGLPLVPASAAVSRLDETEPAAKRASPAQGLALFARLEKKVTGPGQAAGSESGSGTGGLDIWNLMRSRQQTDPGQVWDCLQARVTARQQERLFEAVRGLLARLAVDTPLLLFFEDAQWLDAASRALVDHLAERLADQPLCLLLAQRSTEVDPGCPPAAWEAIITLRPLTATGTAALAAHLLGAEPLADDLARAIYHHSGGNPLFVEELATWLQRSGQSGLAGLDLATSLTLQELVLSRIDSLPLAQRDTLRSASVAGSDFRFGEVRALFPPRADDQSLAASLAGLDRARLLLLVQDSLDAHYAFRQAIVREVGYHSQSAARRRQLHARLAAYLEARHAPELIPHAELLALHHELAGCALPAARYLLLAGQKAQKRYAYPQAADHYRRALALLEQLPANEQGAGGRLVAAGAHQGLGDVALLTGDFSNAAAAYGSALAAGADPGRLDWQPPAGLYARLALVLPTQEREAEAGDYARLAWATCAAGRDRVTADARDLGCAATLAWLLWRAGDGQADDWIERGQALAAGITAPGAAHLSALLTDLAGDWPAAVRAYVALDHLAGAALVTCRQGDERLSHGHVTSAAGRYEQAAALWEGENDSCGLALARYRQAECQRLVGQAAAARANLRQALALLQAAPAAAHEDRQAVGLALQALDAGQPDPWSAARSPVARYWRRYDDAFRISLLFRPWQMAGIALAAMPPAADHGKQEDVS